MGEDARVITGPSRLDLKPTVAVEHINEQLDDLGIVIDDEDAAFAAFEAVRRDAVVLHEGDQGIAGNPPEPASGDSKSLQPARIKTADDGLLRNLADVSRFAGGEYRLHVQ